MLRVAPLVLAAMVLCTILAITTSAYSSTVGLSREFLRQIITGISIGDALMDRAREFAVEQLYTLHDSAETLLLPYISVCRHIVTDAIEEYDILRMAEEYLLPRPSYEDMIFHAERGACVWTMSSTGLPANFSPHTGTLFLLLATNICTAIFCLTIGATIFAPLRIVWRITKALVSFAAKPKATRETVLENLGTALATLAAAGINVFLFFATGLLFCSANIAVWAGNLNIGFSTKRPAPEPKEPVVFYRTLPDPRVPQLEEKVAKLESEMAEKDEIRESNRQQDATEIHKLRGENEVLEDANLRQKLVLRGHSTMHDAIDLNTSMFVQLTEERQRSNAIQGDLDRTVEDKKVMEQDLWKQIGDKTDDIRTLKQSLRACDEEKAALLASREYHQHRADMGDECSRLQIEFQKGRIQDLEKLVSSEKEALEARAKELLATIESLEAQLKERDELINAEKEAKQALEARIKEQASRHSSEQKAQKAHLLKGFERERKKLVDLSRLSSEARKAAEEKYRAAEEARKAADEARDAAEQARKTEEEARKAAEKDSATNLDARKAAEEALKAVEEKRNVAEAALKAAEDARRAAEEESAANLKALQAAEEALKIAEEARKAAEDESASLRERLDNRPAYHDQGTQASSPPPPPPKLPLPPPPTLGPVPPPGKGKGKFNCPPVGQRPMLGAKSVSKQGSNLPPPNSGPKKSTNLPDIDITDFMFNFLGGGSTPNIPGTNPAAPTLGPKTPPAAPSNPEPKMPPAVPSAPASTTPEPTNPPAGPSNPEATNVPPASSAPEPTNPPAGASNPEPKVPEAAPSTEEPTNPPAGSSNPESTNPPPVPSTPEPTNPPAAPSTGTPEPTNPPSGSSNPEPKTPEAVPSTQEPTNPPVGASNPEPANPPPASSSPEPTNPPTRPSTPELAPAEGGPGKPSGGSVES